MEPELYRFGGEVSPSESQMIDRGQYLLFLIDSIMQSFWDHFLALFLAAH